MTRRPAKWWAERRYVLKLRAELEEVASEIWSDGGSEREQIRSVLADLAKTSGDFKQLAAWALTSITSALMSQIRCAPLRPAPIKHPPAGKGKICLIGVHDLCISVL